GGSLLSWQAKANLSMLGLAVGIALVWHLAVWATSDGLGVLEVGRTVTALVRFHPLTIDGVDTAATTVVAVTFGVLVVAVLGAYLGLVFAWYGRARRRRRGKGLADQAVVKSAAGERRARTSAAITRPGLTDKERQQIPLEQVGLQLAEEATSGAPVIFTHEDALAVIAPSGAGKSRYVMIPACLSAPGALVVTSNEVSILDVIAGPRGRVGKVWVFDPLNRASWPVPMVWDPVGGCQDGHRALSRGHAFAAGLAANNSGSTNAGFFQKNSSSALTRMLHAAALGGKSMDDVLGWAIRLDNGAQEPQDLIEASTDPRAEPLWAGMLRSVATGADETVASSRQTLQQAIEPLALRSVMAWVTPRAGVDTFDADQFVLSTDTLVLLSDDNSATNVGPLCTMVFQEVIDAVKAYAPLSEHGRLDPPMRIVGDEIANVAPIEKLPETVTEIRKLGCQVLLAFQSPGQAVARWGEHRGNTLMEQMAAEVILPGVKSPKALQHYSDLVGEVEVAEESTSHDRDGRHSSGSTSVHLRRVLRPDEIRELDAGLGLVVFRNAPAIVVRFTPWFARPGGAGLAKEATATADWRRNHHDRARRKTRAAAYSSPPATAAAVVPTPLCQACLRHPTGCGVAV
ncbi:MAG: type IV secretory system conjugative DNA transfer family protein, partial [Humibacillus sp.]|nr:type IV secretory system conjugative DNA transfer family protein [Humibacillus sp.]